VIVLGIDPGMTGAIAVIDRGQLVALMSMPVADGRVDGTAVADLLLDYMPDHVCIEDVHAMPRNGSISGFKLGYNLGVVIGAVHAARIPLTRVSPQRWKKTYSLIGKDKSASRSLAMELYPSHAGDFRLKRDDGKADAVLIARWAAGTLIQQANAIEATTATPPAQDAAQVVRIDRELATEREGTLP
jgi:crossover junction endodeoxyribonuclease RuvC